MLGKTVTVTIDRPLGSAHPKYPSTVYPVNYGYVAEYEGGDGQHQDAYVLGVNEPLEEFTGRVIGVIHRRDDVETKWVVAPPGLRLHQAQIMEQVAFQEKHFRGWINALYERSCGMIPYRITERRPGDIPVCYADPKKAAEMLGWTAKRDLTTMCRDAWNWQKNNPLGYNVK